MIILGKKALPEKSFSIKKLIHERVANFQEARSLEIIHASDVTKSMVGFCPREYVLTKRLMKKRKGELLGTSLQITFNTGNDFQKHINEDYLVDVMYGDWSCLVCGKIKQNQKKPEEGSCSHNDQGLKSLWQYDEPRIMSEYSGISCGIDASIDVGKKKRRAIEMKSIDKDQFKELIAPLAEHKLRTGLYLRCIGESSAKDAKAMSSKEGMVLYQTKSFGFKDEEYKKWGLSDAPFSPFKEYIIERDDSHTDLVSEKSRVAFSHDIKGEGMPAGVCPNSFGERAMKCPVIKECWGGSYPPEVTWLANGKEHHKNLELIPQDEKLWNKKIKKKKS